MDSAFETEREIEERKRDALDKVRTETARYLRKYARRIKYIGEERVKAAFALDPNSDPEVAANDALQFASQGQFLALEGGTGAVQAETTQ
jgi:hypothetical protein